LRIRQSDKLHTKHCLCSKYRLKISAPDRCAAQCLRAVVLAIDAQATRRGDQVLPARNLRGGKRLQRMPGNGAVEQSQFTPTRKRHSRQLQAVIKRMRAEITG